MIKKMIYSEHFPILALFTVAFIIGIAIFRDYGQSFDEGEIYWYGDYSLKSYSKALKGRIIQDFELSNLNYYGPAYFMMASLLSKTQRALFPTLTLSQTWHLVSFVSFLCGSVFIYTLARRWLSQIASLGTSVLYLTQPLLWGHAFINPKDIPFMFFFLASIVTGLWMCDKIFQPNQTPRLAPSNLGFINRILETGASFLRRKPSVRIAILWVFSFFLLWVFTNQLDQFITKLINNAYSAPPQSFLGYWFAEVAPNAKNIPLSSYTYKALILFHSAKMLFTFLGTLFATWCMFWGYFKPLKLKGLSNLLHKWLPLFLNWPVIVAGIILGLTTSVRVLGPLAGVIVTMYALYKYKKKAVIPLLVYVAIAVCVMYLAWPFLWKEPAKRLYDAFMMMSTYPWFGTVLFNGTYYPSHDIPWSYLPVLLTIQLTEPALLLFFIGSIIITILCLKFHVKLDLLLIVSLWFFIPLLGLIVTHRPLYDNFRQLLFLLPPVFLLGGVALEFVFQHLNKLVWRAIILVAVASTGLYSIVSLHPYQYIYYNSLIGGTRGAFQRFETDYWLISYKEAVDFINSEAPVGATIVIPLGHHLVQTRPDLIVRHSGSFDATSYDYVLLNSRTNGIDDFPEDRTVLRVEREGAILSVVKLSSKYSSP